jgi:hypothetical protein
MDYPFADLALARRLERAEGAACRRTVEARARVAPAIGATAIAVGGALAMFDGPSSPLTQTFGLGIFEAPTESQLATLEAFFRERGAPVHHETSPMADPALPALLAARGYRPIEYSSVLYRPVGAEAARPVANAALTVTRVVDDAERWARTAAAGWGESPQLADFMLDIGRVQAAAQGTHLFLAEQDGEAIAAGALAVHDGVALLAGASTIPSGRRRGAQLALLDARLAYAASAGCDLAMMAALPGSGSQRNAERHGFRIAYTRVKWRAEGP